MVDNLFILRGIIDHAKYLGRELWLTFYDIEKCFDRLWLEDCINSLWDNGVTDDILYLIYMMNRRANIVIRTPFGNTESFTIDSLVNRVLHLDLFLTIVHWMRFVYTVIVISMGQ